MKCFKWKALALQAKDGDDNSSMCSDTSEPIHGRLTNTNILTVFRVVQSFAYLLELKTQCYTKLYTIKNTTKNSLSMCFAVFWA